MASQQKSIFYRIVRGPSKEGLKAALFDGLRLMFHIEHHGDRNQFEIAVTRVEREDGSGNSWNIRGMAVRSLGGGYIELYYNSHSRNGVAKFLLQESFATADQSERYECVPIETFFSRG